ncbi:MAG: NYN domain-containing protein [Acidobacteriota bacterium]|nr:NYN domain-containing protein [Thermoanaerobaculaceae bacterium]
MRDSIAIKERSLLIIDGGYLDFIQRHFGSPRLDYGRLSHAICDYFGYNLIRCVYFNCLPYLSNTPTEEEQDAFEKKSGFYQRLQKLERFEVKLGHLAYRGIDELTGKPVLEQKQIDVLITAEMVYAAARRNVPAIFLLSGDGDFLPAVEIVKREGLTFGLVHGSRSGTFLTVHEQLWLAADLRLELTRDFLDPFIREG